MDHDLGDSLWPLACESWYFMAILHFYLHVCIYNGIYIIYNPADLLRFMVKPAGTSIQSVILNLGTLPLRLISRLLSKCHHELSLGDMEISKSISVCDRCPRGET